MLEKLTEQLRNWCKCRITCLSQCCLIVHDDLQAPIIERQESPDSSTFLHQKDMISYLPQEPPSDNH